MDLSLMKILLKFLNYPLNLSPLYSQPAVLIFLLALSLPLLSHAAANPNREFFNYFDFIDLFTIKKFFNCCNFFAFIVSIVFFPPCIRYAGTGHVICKLRETTM